MSVFKWCEALCFARQSLGTMISSSTHRPSVMAALSSFGVARLRALVPPDLWGRMEGGLSGAEVPKGDRGIDGERNDQLAHGDFRSRYEHLVRYRSVSGTRYGLLMDLGCGTGYGASILSKQNEVIGIDSSAVAVAYARRSFPEIELVRASGESLPISDGSLDAIVAFEVIEHLANPERMLDECKRMLRRGGVLHISTPNPAHMGNVWQNRLFGKPMPSKVDMTNPYHMREFSYNGMRSMLASKGFRLVTASGQTLPFDWCVPGLGYVHRRLLPKAGLSDAYEWFSSRVAKRLPSMAWTVVYSALRE